MVSGVGKRRRTWVGKEEKLYGKMSEEMEEKKEEIENRSTL